MKTLKAFTALFLLLTSIAVAEEYISICSFNIAELGAHRENKNHRAIADIIDDFDLTVVQEVMNSGGEDHIIAIVDSMNVSAIDKFSYFVISNAGRGYPGNEGYAYIYRSPVELDTSYSTPYGLKDTEGIYGRIPGWAYFRAENFDFMVVGLHLHWSDLDKRTAEVADLLAWMKEFADKPDSEERDLIIVGDTNRFGDYSATKYNNRETAFHQLLDDSSLGEKYRLLFCEYLPAMDTKESPDDAGSTSVTNNNNMVYDQIFISSGVFYEFGEESGALDDNIGIIDYDTPMSQDNDTIKDLISDHRPIYAKFRIDLEDDDGITSGIGENKPFEFKLNGNYPNPFNPLTNIQFELPEKSHVQLNVFSISGQHVQTLLDSPVYGGDHLVKWEPDGLSAGIYLYSLEANNKVQMGKMLYLK
ncbi:endonuclease/exonuclease/phosphatase family protein [Candidatus Latescibacterota bacterium]